MCTFGESPANIIGSDNSACLPDVDDQLSTLPGHDDDSTVKHIYCECSSSSSSVSRLCALLSFRALVCHITVPAHGYFVFAQLIYCTCNV